MLLERVLTSLGTKCLIEGRTDAIEYFDRAHLLGDSQATAIVGLFFEFGLLGTEISYIRADK